MLYLLNLFPIFSFRLFGNDNVSDIFLFQYILLLRVYLLLSVCFPIWLIIPNTLRHFYFILWKVHALYYFYGLHKISFWIENLDRYFYYIVIMNTIPAIVFFRHSLLLEFSPHSVECGYYCLYSLASDYPSASVHCGSGKINEALMRSYLVFFFYFFKLHFFLFFSSSLTVLIIGGVSGRAVLNFLINILWDYI